jgi:hypothetical protein
MVTKHDEDKPAKPYDLSHLALEPRELRVLLVSHAATLAQGISNEMLTREQIIEVVARMGSFAVRLPPDPEPVTTPDEEQEAAVKRKMGLN